MNVPAPFLSLPDLAVLFPTLPVTSCLNMVPAVEAVTSVKLLDFPQKTVSGRIITA